MLNPFNRNNTRRSTPEQRPAQYAPEVPEPVLPVEDKSDMVVDSSEKQSGALQLFTLDEVVRLLQVDSAQLNTWVQVFRASLTEYTRGYNPRFSPDDISTLFFVGNLAHSGHTIDQISSQLTERRNQLANRAYAEVEIVSTQEVPTIPLENNVTFRDRVPNYQPEPMPPTPISPEPVPASFNSNGRQPLMPEAATPTSITESTPAGVATRQANEILSTVANSQQAVLNIQDSMRETIGVVVQDNFNLKHENRKLRERMLEIERSLAEQQRREETRKDIFEGRLRAVEGTLAAMQQQFAQIIQIQRNRGQSRRNNWFR